MSETTYSVEEGWETLQDGHKVFTKTWKPTTAPVALLLLVHGFSDHVNNYYTLFPTLAARKVQCHAFDQRGWGRSVENAAQRGLTGTTTMVLDDITTILNTILPISSEQRLPLFLMGHSMGGGEILQYAVRGPAEIRSQIRGYIAESPYIALHPAQQPNRFTVIGGRAVSKIAPKKHMVRSFDSRLICRDEQVCKDYENDELCHDTGTLEGLANMLDRAHELNTGAIVPAEGSYWIGHGDADLITSYDASKVFFDRLKVQDKEFKTYKGWYHKLHAEPGNDKIQFANDVGDWILARSASSFQEPKSKL